MLTRMFNCLGYHDKEGLTVKTFLQIYVYRDVSKRIKNKGFFVDNNNLGQVGFCLKQFASGNISMELPDGSLTGLYYFIPHRNQSFDFSRYQRLYDSKLEFRTKINLVTSVYFVEFSSKQTQCTHNKV